MFVILAFSELLVSITPFLNKLKVGEVMSEPGWVYGPTHAELRRLLCARQAIGTSSLAARYHILTSRNPPSFLWRCDHDASYPPMLGCYC